MDYSSITFPEHSRQLQASQSGKQSDVEQKAAGQASGPRAPSSMGLTGWLVVPKFYMVSLLICCFMNVQMAIL